MRKQRSHLQLCSQSSRKHTRQDLTRFKRVKTRNLETCSWNKYGCQVANRQKSVSNKNLLKLSNKEGKRLISRTLANRITCKVTDGDAHELSGDSAHTAVNGPDALKHLTGSTPEVQFPLTLKLRRLKFGKNKTPIYHNKVLKLA